MLTSTVSITPHTSESPLILSMLSVRPEGEEEQMEDEEAELVEFTMKDDAEVSRKVPGRPLYPRIVSSLPSSSVE